MPQAHRNNDSRFCGALTIVQGQSSVFVNGRLWAVDNDPNTHGAGGLIPSGTSVFINNKKVIVLFPDQARIDNLDHVAMQDATADGSSNVFAFG